MLVSLSADYSYVKANNGKKSNIMNKAIIVLDDLYLKNESALETAVSLKGTQDDIFIITKSEDVHDHNVIPLTDNTVKDFLAVSSQIEKAEEITFVVMPNQYAFVKFLANKVFGQSRPITYEYVPVNVRGYEYIESISQYVSQMTSYIQKLDSIEDGNFEELAQIV